MTTKLKYSTLNNLEALLTMDNINCYKSNSLKQQALDKFSLIGYSSIHHLVNYYIW